MVTINSVDNGLTGSTGSGNFVGSTSPTLVTPVLGTPTSGTLSNCTSATTPTASVVPSWDANKNLAANNFNNGFTTTVSSAGAITLTVSSTGIQVITGSTAQTVNLPVATTLVAGQSFRFISTSSNSVTIKTSGGNTLTTLSGTSNCTVTCVNPSGGTGTASWVATTSIGTAVAQVNGDSGSATPSSLGVLAINAGQSVLTCGQTVKFAASSTTVGMQVTDANLNTIIGLSSGKAGQSGSNDTGLGALVFAAATSTGGSNTAIGYLSLTSLTTGGALGNNCGCGANTLQNITTGYYNTAIGAGAGVSLTTSDNSNILIGHPGVAGHSNEIRIGFPGGGTGGVSTAYIAGIYGVTTTSATTSPVLVSNGDQLGTIVSSRRYKENIQPIEDTNLVSKLDPVQFNYKAHKNKEIEYGLIAEDVFVVAPQLVNLDKEGNPESVKYHLLPPLLLNEIQRLEKRISDLEKRYINRA